MPRLLPAESMRLLTKVSKLYYEEGMRQDQIVAKLNLSRSKISRLLQQARDEGVVQITVMSPAGVYPDLELQLERRFRIQEVIVIETRQPEVQASVSRELGVAAASYLHSLINERMVIGISWGASLSAMVDALPPRRFPLVNVVQIVGGLGPHQSEVHATDLAQRMARRFNSRLTLLPAPGIVDNQHTRAVFLTDSHVQSAFELFGRIDVAFVGVGSPETFSINGPYRAIIKDEELAELLNLGAVGDIALRFFDHYGNLIDSDVDKRIIGIDLEQLSRIETVVGVAGGPLKVDALLGALRGQLLDVLITDHVTALRLLDRATNKPAGTHH